MSVFGVELLQTELGFLLLFHAIYAATFSALSKRPAVLSRLWTGSPSGASTSGGKCPCDVRTLKLRSKLARLRVYSLQWVPMSEGIQSHAERTPAI